VALDTVQDYLTEVRTLLQDKREPYRYSSDSIVSELNLSMLETRKMRPDLFLKYYRTDFPTFAATTPEELATPVPFELIYRMALVYYICGKCILRDEEENDDARAGKFLAKHARSLLTTEG